MKGLLFLLFLLFFFFFFFLLLLLFSSLVCLTPSTDNLVLQDNMRIQKLKIDDLRYEVNAAKRKEGGRGRVLLEANRRDSFAL